MLRPDLISHLVRAVAGRKGPGWSLRFPDQVQDRQPAGRRALRPIVLLEAAPDVILIIRN